MLCYLLNYNCLHIIGGGGYTIENVSRLWAYETSLALDKELPDTISMND
jgi:histone deacetylase 1/2